MPDLLAFTLVEIAVGIAIIAIAALVLLAIYNGMKGGITSTTYVGSWVTKPNPIPAAPGTGTFTYAVTKSVSGAPVAGAPDRSIKFELKPASAGAGRLMSVTVGASNTDLSLGPPVLAFVGVTDASGLIQVVVELEKDRSAELIASNPSGPEKDPPLQFTAR